MTDLAVRLEELAVAGRIVTPLHDVYRKVRLLCSGEPRVTFGLSELLPATPAEVLEGLAELTGTVLPPEGAVGAERSWVDPAGVVAQAERAAARLRQACERGERVLFGTGHPAGPIDMYVRLADAMVAAGAEVVRVAEAEGVAIDAGYGSGQIRYVGRVACLSSGGDLLHTHSARPMERILDADRVPDLVVGDHGFAGAGLARGAEAVALVDTNDPALVLAWVRGLGIWPVVCDDNRPPSCYEPLTELLISSL